ncbi:PepSY-associated TM helix domain-containing protein [Cupriavidus sp. CuC1]|uniref:PepSY-associated TM helix domain-containing protein n=1 Tax=Cupriavidus sp. CuC1 TaxID=3373131 RepID=UPI0037D54F90
MRTALVALHRYVGLVMAGFLLIAGLTGSLLAWEHQLDDMINPALFRAEAPAPGAALLDPLVLRERVMRQYPDARMPYAPLKVEEGRSVAFFLQAAQAAELPNDEVFANPYTGAVQGERKWGDIRQGMKNVMPFIERLHYSLALGTVGTYAFGIVALLWSLDCFVGAFLTFPARMRRPAGRGVKASGTSWLARWHTAWTVRWHGGSHKLNFDLHRAAGLWTWAMLFVLAWSGVSFNLVEVYEPVMKAVFAHQPGDEMLVTPANARSEPGLAWDEAREVGQRLIAQLARAQGFTVIEETGLFHDSALGVYRYTVRSSRDLREDGGLTTVVFDAGTGMQVGSWLPTGAASGDTIRSWISSLHMATLWGRPFKAFMCVLGLLVAMLSVTGTVIWVRKRRAKAKVKARRA